MPLLQEIFKTLKDFITKFKAKKKESLEEQILKGLEYFTAQKRFH